MSFSTGMMLARAADRSHDREIENYKKEIEHLECKLAHASHDAWEVGYEMGWDDGIGYETGGDWRKPVGVRPNPHPIPGAEPISQESEETMNEQEKPEEKPKGEPRVAEVVGGEAEDIQKVMDQVAATQQPTIPNAAVAGAPIMSSGPGAVVAPRRPALPRVHPFGAQYLTGGAPGIAGTVPAAGQGATPEQELDVAIATLAERVIRSVIDPGSMDTVVKAGVERDVQKLRALIAYATLCASTGS